MLVSDWPALKQDWVTEKLLIMLAQLDIYVWMQPLDPISGRIVRVPLDQYKQVNVFVVLVLYQLRTAQQYTGYEVHTELC